MRVARDAAPDVLRGTDSTTIRTGITDEPETHPPSDSEGVPGLVLAEQGARQSERDQPARQMHLRELPDDHALEDEGFSQAFPGCACSFHEKTIR